MFLFIHIEYVSQGHGNTLFTKYHSNLIANIIKGKEIWHQQLWYYVICILFIIKNCFPFFSFYPKTRIADPSRNEAEYIRMEKWSFIPIKNIHWAIKFKTIFGK